MLGWTNGLFQKGTLMKNGMSNGEAEKYMAKFDQIIQNKKKVNRLIWLYVNRCNWKALYLKTEWFVFRNFLFETPNFLLRSQTYLIWITFFVRFAWRKYPTKTFDFSFVWRRPTTVFANSMAILLFSTYLFFSLNSPFSWSKFLRLICFSWK